MRSTKTSLWLWVVLPNFSAIVLLFGSGGCSSPSTGTKNDSLNVEKGGGSGQDKPVNSVAAAAASAETAEISRQLSTVIPALPTFRDRVEALHELVTKHPEAKIEGDARQLLRKWLKTGIVEKAAPIADPDTKEAEKNDGTLYIGIFETSVGYIKYWRNKEEHRDLRAYQTLHPEDLVGKPGPLTPVKLTEQYAVARDALLQEADSSEAWKQFAVIAKRLQQDLDAYVQQGGNGMGANFRNSADFARDVNGIWSEHIQPLFR